MGSDRELQAARYSAMRWNTPLSEAHAEVLIESLELGGAASVLDPGCGSAEFLIRVVQSTDAGCTGTGVDTDGELLEWPLAEVIEHALNVGWRLLSLSTADQREWDDFEASWRLGRERWLLAHPDDPHVPELRKELDDRLREYVSEYRGVLGFCYVVLTR